MKRIIRMVITIAFAAFFCIPVHAAVDADFDTQSQLDALGKDELMESVPEDAKALMQESGVYDMSVENLLHLSPQDFFRAIWSHLVEQVRSPVTTLATITGIILLSALLGGLQSSSWSEPLSEVFNTVTVLCVVLAIAKPILDCIIQTTQAVRDASIFMLSFVPVFSAAMFASGQPVTGAAYNMLLFSTCQVVSQVVSGTLVPMMSIYLAICVVGPLVPEIKISSATKTIKSIVTWGLGFFFSIFVGVLSIQSLVATGADSAATKAAKFLLGSFVPVIGGALSDAYLAAQGCLKLIKTSVGAYGILVAAFTFLPVLLKAFIWYGIANLSVIASDIVGVPAVSEVLKACSTVLGILVAVIMCYALLLIVSTAVVLVTGLGVG